MLEKFHLDWKIFLSNQTAKVMPSVYLWNQLEFVFSMCDCKAKVFAGLLVLLLLRLIFEGNNFPVSNNFSSTSMTSIHLWISVKKEKKKSTLRTQKNANCLWDNNSKEKLSFVVFVKNDGVDSDDNANLVGSKLIATWSQSITCPGLTIFENEATENITHYFL